MMVYRQICFRALTMRNEFWGKPQKNTANLLRQLDAIFIEELRTLRSTPARTGTS
jgi:hypothetical protein